MGVRVMKLSPIRLGPCLTPSSDPTNPVETVPCLSLLAQGMVLGAD